MMNYSKYLLLLLVVMAGCRNEDKNGVQMTEQERIVAQNVASQTVIENNREIYQRWFDDEGHLVQEEFAPASFSSPFDETWMLFEENCDTAETAGNREVITYKYDGSPDYRKVVLTVKGCVQNILLENVLSYNGLLSRQVYRDTDGNELATRIYQYKQPGLLERVVFIAGADTLSSAFFKYDGNRMREELRHEHRNGRHVTIKYGRDGLPVEAFVTEGDKISHYYEFRNSSRGESKKAIQLLEPR
ncbi:MAG: hypothetical protein WD077_04880 [Bacteroidia bacterium]